jgi:hypothetical protein
MKELFLVTGVVVKISCPMLVTDVEANMSSPGIAWKLYDALLICPKEFRFSTAEVGADELQVGAAMISNERICVWLEGFLIKTE